MGFKELVPDEYSGYIITSYLCPSDEKFDFKQFYERLSDMGELGSIGLDEKIRCINF